MQYLINCRKCREEDKSSRKLQSYAFGTEYKWSIHKRKLKYENEIVEFDSFSNSTMKETIDYVARNLYPIFEPIVQI